MFSDFWVALLLETELREIWVSMLVQPLRGKYEMRAEELFFLTPYSGINISHGFYNDWYSYYDPNMNTYYNDTYHFTTVTFPVGIKFEYQYKKFFCGVNANLAVGVGTQDRMFQGFNGSGRLMFFVGIKF